MSQQPRKVIHLPQVRMLGRNRPMPSIRITKVKSVKPRDPEVAKKEEETKLREQVSKEIESKNRMCGNKSFECPYPVLRGYGYCARHILQEPGVPFRACNGGEKCAMPVPLHTQTDRRDMGFCFEHARQAQAIRMRAAAPAPQTLSTETLLNNLAHYVKAERVRTTSCASSVSVVSEPADTDQGVPHAVDPFKQIDAVQVNQAFTSSILECLSASDSEGEGEGVTLGRGGDVRTNDERLSADESELDPKFALRRAGIYTAEEAVTEAKNSLLCLQNAYINQMGRLRSLLQTARLQYLRGLRAEKEQYCSINSQARSGPLTAKERLQLKKLKHYASYHRKHGVDAILARKLHRKRAKMVDLQNRPIPSQARCTFTEGGVRCATQVVPTSKYCLKHVLEDKYQILFTACGDSRGGVTCREPIARLPLVSACRYHTDPPPYTVFSLKKEDSDSDSEVTNTASAFSPDYNDRRHSLEENVHIEPAMSLPFL